MSMGKIVYAIFSSHGPDLLTLGRGIFDSFEESERKVVEALEACSENIRKVKPDAVIAISPHWYTGGRFLIDGSKKLPCIQDYYGFSPNFYSFRYDAAGEPELAKAIADSLVRDGFQAELTGGRGLDHGHWVPLHYLLPERNVPVVPLSITGLSAEEHYSSGISIAHALNDYSGRIAILATGALLHRMDLITSFELNDEWPEGEIFLKHIGEALSTMDVEAIKSMAAQRSEAGPEAGLRTLMLLLGALSNTEVHANVLSATRIATYTSNNVIEFITANR